MKPLMAAILMGSVLMTTTASAEPSVGPASKPGLAASIARVRFEAETPASFASMAQTRVSSRSRRVAAAVGLGFLGMLGGGWLGLKLDQLDPCACDDPGLLGLVIGVPIGAVVGGVVGYKLAR